jgi:hydroxypyruvate reductase/glycerate 2-kinase
MNPVDDAIAIWKAGVAAVDPRMLVGKSIESLKTLIPDLLIEKPRILVVGGGKAGAAMAMGVEDAFPTMLDAIEGIVNVPEGATESPKRIHLNAARPAGSNFPTAEGVAGATAMRLLLEEANPNDLAFCLLSGGGSALMPYPAGITLEEKQSLTAQLHASGATIAEMNCVRKHLSKIKGGRLAEAFRGRLLIGLIISDVIGDPLDVIASGPTVPDPTTLAEARDILFRYRIRVPDRIIDRLEDAASETPKRIPSGVMNLVIGSNAIALQASRTYAESRQYITIDFGSGLDGEARSTGVLTAGNIPNIMKRPTAILFGGETTVTLGPNPGKGGRNQEFVLAMLCELGIEKMKGVTILSGGTDGEDGPTDAAGAIGTQETLLRAKSLNLDPRDFLARHDAYHFFEAVGGLFKTGLTGTNVMDLGVILLN